MIRSSERKADLFLNSIESRFVSKETVHREYLTFLYANLCEGMNSLTHEGHMREVTLCLLNESYSQVCSCKGMHQVPNSFVVLLDLILAGGLATIIFMYIFIDQSPINNGNIQWDFPF